MLRVILAVVLSIAVALVLFMVVEGVAAILHRWPDDFEGTMDETAHLVETTSAWVRALLCRVGYVAIMVICTFVATRDGHNRNPWHGFRVGMLMNAKIVDRCGKVRVPGVGELVALEPCFGSVVAPVNPTHRSFDSKAHQVKLGFYSNGAEPISSLLLTPANK